jgi:Protein of unknown function (DUF1194)
MSVPRLALLLLMALGLARPAAAQTQVDLALVLAVDVSGSVNASRYELQRRGYAAAFRNPRVVSAILGGAHQAIAVALVQWTGPELHIVSVDWMRVGDKASADALAETLDAMPRALFGGGTSLSGAIDFGMAMLARAPYRAERRVIDISGDGSNNRGRPAEVARDEAVKDGVTINGVPILSLEPDLDAYYRQFVIGGQGAFVIAAQNYDTFADAILDKLVNEIAGVPPRAGLVAR